MRSVGLAKGYYAKQHLVPFGEYIPAPFRSIVDAMGVPDANLLPGKPEQPLISVGSHSIASLICYELAYPNLLRAQLPKAEWIVSVSDDGWFGHSLAAHQQLQMSQALSLQTGRYQVVANNDGLSSLIDDRGEIIDGLPAHSTGLLAGNIHASTGITPWVNWGDLPVWIAISLGLCWGIIRLVLRRLRN